MRWQSGIVMETERRHVVILTPQGEFKRIKMNGRIPDVGEEIRVPLQRGLFNNLPTARWLAVAAAIIMFVLASPLLTIMTQPPEVAVAYVAIDINPSVELTVSNRDNVLDVKAYNSDGDKVLAGLNIKGINYKTAVSQIGRQAIKLGFISKDTANNFVISLSPISNAEFDKAAMERTLLASANEVLANSRVNGEVKTIQVPVELRERATQKGISPAKYAVLLEAVTSGLPVTEKDMQEKSIEVAIASAGGKPDQIINQAQEEDEFEDKEQRYFAILRSGSAIAMEQATGEEESDPAEFAANTKENSLAGEKPSDGSEKQNNRKPLIETVRRTGDPEGSRDGNDASASARPQEPSASAAASVKNPPVQDPSQPNNTETGLKPDANVDSTNKNDVDIATDDNTEENYMGTPVNQDAAGENNQDMNILKPNF